MNTAIRNQDDALAWVSAHALSLNDGTLTLDWDDELIAQTCVTHDGVIKHEATRQLVEGATP